MAMYEGLARGVRTNWQGLLETIMRSSTPDRVYNMELFQDREVAVAIAARFDLAAELDPAEPQFEMRRTIAVNRFCGFDYIRCGLDGLDMPLNSQSVADTAEMARDGGRNYQDEHTGPIMSWEDFHAYPWPEVDRDECTASLEWLQANLPEDMCIIASGGIGHFSEYLQWLMGYETLCYALFEQRDLVAAIAERLLEMYRVVVRRVLEFDRVKMVWSSDDMGFKTGLMISPDDTRQFILTGHKALAEISHAAGRPYLLHSCGKLSDIMEDLIEDVKIDAKHSFEDTIEDVRDAKRAYGDRIALIGGIDVDFLCRQDEAAIRRRVRETLDACQPGGGYALGTGNTPANYVPLDNYLALIDEGMLYGGRG